MIETIVIAIQSILLIVALYGWIFLKKTQVNLILKLTQAQLDQNMLQQKLAQINEDKRLLESEEFMQFLNSSREYAFEYIEAVQEAISEYNRVVEPILKYHRTYGMAFGAESVPSQNLDEISKAHEALMEIMPSEPNKLN